MRANENIRNNIKSNRLRMWEVAEQIGISDSRLSIWMRTPLSEERRTRVNKAINELLQKISS